MSTKRQFSKETQCDGKRQYRKQGVKRALKGSRKSGLNLELYHCPWCEYWHLGHKIGFGPRSAEDPTMESVHQLRGLAANWRTDIPVDIRPAPSVWAECKCGWRSETVLDPEQARAIHNAHQGGIAV